MQPFTDIPGLTTKVFGNPDNPIYSLEGMIQLPVWAGFQSRQSPYASLNNNYPSDGTVGLHLGSDRVVHQPVISPEQVAAYHHLVANQAAIQNAILTVLLQQYHGLQAVYGYDPEEAKKFMPNVTSIEGFKNLIGLSTIHILEVVKDGMAYVGYSFGCRWDEEHGLGIMSHGERIIDLGGVDTSFLSWIAEKDLEPASIEPTPPPSTKSIVQSQQPKKQWWKFWL